MQLTGRGIEGKVSTQEVAIVGDGARSLAVASVLSLKGQTIRLWTPDGSAPSECEIREREAKVGHTRGKVKFNFSSGNLTATVKGVPLVIISAPVTEYGAVVDSLAPALSSGQTIVLTNAPLGASLQFNHELGLSRTGLQLNILELGSLFDWVRIEGDVVLVSGPRRRVAACGLTRNETHRGLTAVSGILTGLVPASNVLERGFSDVERLVRPILRLFRLAGSRTAGSRDVSDCITPEVVAILESVWAEVKLVARGFGLSVRPIGQQLHDFCGVGGDSLAESVEELAASFLIEERGQTGDICRDKLRREVRETLQLLSAFALMVRQPVAALDAMVELASVVTGSDLRKDGRSLDDLGLVGFDAEEIIETVNA